MMRRHSQRRRRGLETIELLLAFPLILIVLGGGFEYGWLILRSVQLDHAARAGARVASLGETDAGDVLSRVETVLSASGINDATIRIEPPDPTTLPPGAAVIVEVSVNYGDLQLLGLSRIMPLPEVLTGKAGMVREP